MAWQPVDQNVNLNSNANLALGISLGSTNTPFPFKPVYTTLKQTHENLKTLLLTRIGERYMQPTFGTKLLEVIFQPNRNELKPIIDEYIREPVAYWLPYIDIQSINIITDEDEPGMNYDINVTITYSVSQFSDQTITILGSDATITVVGRE